MPLEGEVRGTDHENALRPPAQIELAHPEARHDGLAGTGIVGEQKAHRGQPEQVPVDRFELMRKRVHAGDREPEPGIELVGDPERTGLVSDPDKGVRDAGCLVRQWHPDA